MEFKEEVKKEFRGFQKIICADLEELDGKSIFIEDFWQRPGGGGGFSRTIIKGKVFEKGGVNFSAVHGKTPPKIIKALKLKQSDFFATGLSIVLHPENPMIPIIHCNVRFFQMDNGISWFGGGIDLTPHYIDKAQAKFFHQKLKATCDKHDKSYYPLFKKQADNYFFIKHRNETRGIGGIFFDRLCQTEKRKLRQHFDFVKDVVKTFIPCYTPLVLQNQKKKYGEKEKIWQHLRRGRYVEFNLVYDKGTKFGLDTDGRTESILMSLPPLASWEYNYKAKSGSKESHTLALLKRDVNWINTVV